MCRDPKRALAESSDLNAVTGITVCFPLPAYNSLGSREPMENLPRTLGDPKAVREMARNARSKHPRKWDIVGDLKETARLIVAGVFLLALVLLIEAMVKGAVDAAIDFFPADRKRETSRPERVRALQTGGLVPHRALIILCRISRRL
jgi:hypothetical protein